jgi:putative effector of murein hydrolase
MGELFARVWDNLLARVTGPMSFRLLWQPAVAAIFAIRAGLQDARNGTSPYFWAIVHDDPVERRALLRDGWKSIAKVFVLALVLDMVYQIIVARFVYPGEALLVAVLLACVSYTVIRGLVTRLFRSRAAHSRGHP